MKSAPNAAAVLEWKDALLALSDKRFFELTRIYLGAIKTPFSKQRLVDDLCAFLQKDEVSARVLGCLDELDLKVISAVRFLGRPDRQRLVSFFLGERSYPEIYSRILNMEERLLIFRGNEDSSAGYRINPLFAEELESRLRLSLLVRPAEPPADLVQEGGASFAAMSPAGPVAAAGVFAFFANSNIALTKSSTLKKKDAETFKRIFHALCCPADLLAKALRRLSLVHIDDDGRLEADFGAWRAFAGLTPLERASWLCAAASFPSAASSLLARKAALFALVARQLSPQAAYTGEGVRRLFLLAEDALETRELALVSSQSTSASGMSRFCRLMQESAREEEEAAAPSETEAAVRFGLLVERGGLFAANVDLLKDEKDSSPQGVAVDSSFMATVAPETSLKALLPAARFLLPESLSPPATFRIGRETCFAAFSRGESAESAKAAFANAGAHLPENVLEAIECWHSSFSSLRVFSGIVIKADERLLPLFKAGGRLSSLVQEEIAPGVLLLKGDSMEEIEGALKAEGLDFCLERGKKAAGGAARRFAFQMELPKSRKELNAGETPPADAQPQDISAELQKSLLAKLDAMEIGSYVRSVLEERIRQKTVISEAQLRADGIRYEKTEAGRLDLSGKRLLAEEALREGRLLEVETAEGLPPGAEPQRLIVRPARADKNTLYGALEPDGAPCAFSLARAVRVRLLPQPLFEG